jgi:tetratricopeptide (TPR) repeat protein
LNDLFANYLDRQADAQAAGIASFDSEVTPYEVGPVQPLDPKMAWDEALAVLPMVGGVGVQRRKAPPPWAHLVAGHESIVAIACSAGNFPQLMRNFHAILTQPNLADMRPTATEARAISAELRPWAEDIARGHQFPDMLLALGTLRLAKQFAEAEDFIAKHEASIPSAWRNGWENEKAALAWHSGRYDEARQAWERLEPTAPVLFNRGMAALFSNDAADAKKYLNDALAQMPANSAWHSLGQLYLILADLRS